MAAKHKGDIIKAHLPGKEGINVGFDHRMYCKVLNETEVEKQTRNCERYYREEDESISRSSDDDNEDEEGSVYSEYETESLTSSLAESLDQRSEPSSRERSPESKKLFDDILGKNKNSFYYVLLCMTSISWSLKLPNSTGLFMEL
mgnify:CR=1 FL=1